MSRRIELTPGVQTIEGFAEGDKVVIRHPEQKAYFSTGADPATLEIVQNIDGQTSMVRLVGALPDNPGFILDQATAEKGIGYSFVEFVDD